MSDLPPDFWHGIDLFNREEYFDCHEVLEHVWNHQTEPERTLTQGIIQVAVGLYHSGRDNFVGAEKLLTRGLARLEQSREVLVPLDVNAACDHARQALQSVQEQRKPASFVLVRTQS